MAETGQGMHVTDSRFLETRRYFGRVSTSQEDTSPTAPDPEDGPPAASGPSEENPFLAAAGTPVPVGGVFSAETFSLTGLLLLATVVAGMRLPDLFGWFVLAGSEAEPGQAALLQAEITVAGGLSALAVLMSALALFTSGAGSRAWTRWLATATVLVGSLLVLTAVLAYAGAAA